MIFKTLDIDEISNYEDSLAYFSKIANMSFFRSGREIRSTYRFLCNNGTYLWFLSSASDKSCFSNASAELLTRLKISEN